MSLKSKENEKGPFYFNLSLNMFIKQSGKGCQGMWSRPSALRMASTWLTFGGGRGGSLLFFVFVQFCESTLFRAHSYCIKFVDLLCAVGQSSQCYCVMESFSVDIVPAHQNHRCGGCKRMQGQPREFLAVVLHLVLAAGIKLPGNAIEGCTGYAEGASRQSDVA